MARHPARPDPRRRRDGDEFGERGHQRAAAAPVPSATSAQEILHPPLRARLGQYSYLTTVAAAAIAVGIALTAASYTDTAPH